MKLAEIHQPQTPAARAARELAAEYHSEAMLNHTMRSWLWAEGIAAERSLPGVDHELLYVAALLHDLGTVPEFDNHTLSYEEAAGHVGKALTAGAGWESARRERVAEVIIRHNWASVDPEFDLEGHLLELATGLDITGANIEALPQAFLNEVIETYPRGSLADEFSACVTDQARRKPATAAGRLVNNGLVERMRRHPLE